MNDNYFRRKWRCGIRQRLSGYVSIQKMASLTRLVHRWNGNRRGRCRAAAVLCAVGLALCGCGAGFPFDETEETVKVYTKPQVMIVAATERNRYQEVYTDQIWGVALEDGRTFETYLLDQVKEFLMNLGAMNLLAQQQGVTLTATEQNRLQGLAERYYDGLTAADIAYMGIDEDDVLSMYQEYCLADKVVSSMTEGIDLEVSDSEAKVISVLMIQISGRESAEAVYRRVSQEGSDFLSIAEETSEGEQVQRQLGRGEEPKALEDAAFALKTGEMSSLIECDGWYYIVKCVSDYDAEATKLRKTRIYEERKNQVFQQIFSQFQSENQTSFEEDCWTQIRLAGDDGSTTTDFFRLYQEEFGS